MYWHDDNGWWFMFPLFMVLLLVAIGFVIAALARGGTFGSPRPHSDGDSALEILRHRFASGEIDADEYQRRRELLSH